LYVGSGEIHTENVGKTEGVKRVICTDEASIDSQRDKCP
jgi:hypothetical protein